MQLLNNQNRELLLLQRKLEGIRDGQIAIDKADYLEIIKGSFIGNQIRKKREVMMISLWLKNRNSFGETHGVGLQTIRRMQSGYKTCEVKLMLKKQEKIDITTGSLKKILGRMPNRKSPGPDLVQGFWLKNFSSLHERVRFQLKECLDSGFVPR